MAGISAVTGNAYQRKFKSPPFSFSNGSTITAGSFFLFDFYQDNTTSQSYGAFNNLFVSNASSSNDILIYPNQRQDRGGVIVPHTVNETLGQESIGAVSSLLIKNNGTTTINANEIRITVWKDDATPASVFARLHEKIVSNSISDNIGFRAQELIDKMGYL